MRLAKAGSRATAEAAAPAAMQACAHVPPALLSAAMLCQQACMVTTAHTQSRRACEFTPYMHKGSNSSVMFDSSSRRLHTRCVWSCQCGECAHYFLYDSQSPQPIGGLCLWDTLPIKQHACWMRAACLRAGRQAWRAHRCTAQGGCRGRSWRARVRGRRGRGHRQARRAQAQVVRRMSHCYWSRVP